MNQEEKFALRLKQILAETGLHEIVVYVTPEKEIAFWVVETKKVEGVTSANQIKDWDGITWREKAD